MNAHTRYAIPAVALVAIIIALFGVRYYYANPAAFHQTEKPDSLVDYAQDNTPFKVLTATNPAFAEADAAAAAGKYEEAKMLYAKALSAASDKVQIGQIEYKLASLEDQYGDPITAIGLYKKIVADPAFANYHIVKAYAVQSMGELYFRNGNVAVAKEIFKDQPYAAMVVAGQNQLTLRHLYDYAVTFYPLGISELRIANWYADNLKNVTTDGTSASSTYPAFIKDALALADADIQRTKTDVNAARGIPLILDRKASLYLRLYNAQLATAPEAEKACEEAIHMYASIGRPQNDGFARYYDAVLLSQIGSRNDDVRAILSPLSDASYKGSNAFSFFQNEKANTLGQKDRLVTLARIAPQFKALLLSLGWNEKDF